MIWNIIKKFCGKEKKLKKKDKNIDVEFSDSSTVTASFEATADGQELILSEVKTTRKVHLTNFKQAELPFSWAALTQVEVYGRYIKEDLSKMEIRNAANPKDVKHYTTERLREEFHIPAVGDIRKVITNFTFQRAFPDKHIT